MAKRIVLTLIGLTLSLPCLAGTPQKWSDLPRAVQKTVLENGGKEGMTVDMEEEKINGMVVYEAEVKAKNGKLNDLVITADGTLVTIKTDSGL